MSDITRKPARRGRPRLPDADARSERVVTFVTRSEYARLAHWADLTNRSMSSTCHDLLVDALASHDNKRNES